MLGLLSANEIWESEKKRGNIVTLCKDLDCAIGSGIPIGALTELVGAPGSGKTQLCLQLCVNVQIPRPLRGQEAMALFIDTDHGFSVDRLKELAETCVMRCNLIAKQFKLQEKISSTFGMDTMIQNILYTDCNNYLELLAVIVQLNETLQQNPNIKLIVIDSFSHLLRMVQSSLDRVRIVNQMLTDLQRLARDYGCAVVITNEITTKILNRNQTCFVASLGDSTRHRMQCRVFLRRAENKDNQYYAHIEQSIYKPESTVSFKIEKGGIAGADIEG